MASSDKLLTGGSESTIQRTVGVYGLGALGVGTCLGMVVLIPRVWNLDAGHYAKYAAVAAIATGVTYYVTPLLPSVGPILGPGSPNLLRGPGGSSLTAFSRSLETSFKRIDSTAGGPGGGKGGLSDSVVRALLRPFSVLGSLECPSGLGETGWVSDMFEELPSGDSYMKGVKSSLVVAVKSVPGVVGAATDAVREHTSASVDTMSGYVRGLAARVLNLPGDVSRWFRSALLVRAVSWVKDNPRATAAWAFLFAYGFCSALPTLNEWGSRFWEWHSRSGYGVPRAIVRAREILADNTSVSYPKFPSAALRFFAGPARAVEAPIYSSHSFSAGRRNAATNHLIATVEAAKCNPYIVGTSSVHIGRYPGTTYGGTHVDVGFHMDPIPDNAAFIFIDCAHEGSFAYYADYGRPMAIYAVQPRFTAFSGVITDDPTKSPDYSYSTLESSDVSAEIEYIVQGGSKFVYKPYDFQKAEIATHWYGTTTMFRTYSRRMPGTEHAMILLVPIRRCYLPFAGLFPSVPTLSHYRNYDPKAGVAIMRIHGVTDYCSISFPGVASCVCIPTALLASIYANVAAIVALSDSKGCQPSGHPTSSVTNATIMSQLTSVDDKRSGAALVMKLVGAKTSVSVMPRRTLDPNYTVLSAQPDTNFPALDHLTPDPRGKSDGPSAGRGGAMYAGFVSPIEGAGAPTNSNANDHACIEGRIQALQPSEDIHLTPALRECAAEFTQRLVPEGVVPLELGEVLVDHSRSTQIANFVRAAASGSWLNLPFMVRAFQKKEVYAAPKDSRNISTVPPDHLEEYSRFTKALTAYLKTLPFWGFSHTPREIADIVHRIMSAANSDGISDYTEGDFTRFDGTRSRACAEVEMEAWVRAFPTSPRAMLLFARRERAPGWTSHGLAYNLHNTRISGDADTSLGNTMINAFVAFSAAVRDGKSYDEAWTILTKYWVFAGDDSLGSGVSARSLSEVATDLGMKLKVATKALTQPATFLGRRYPNALASNLSFFSLTRLLPVMPIVYAYATGPNGPTQADGELALFARARGFAVTDAHTPIIAEWVRAMFRSYAHLYDPSSRVSRSDKYWATITPETAPPGYLDSRDPHAITEVASELGWEVDDVIRLMDWFEQWKPGDFFPPPNSGSDPSPSTVAYEQGGEMFNLDRVQSLPVIQREGVTAKPASTLYAELLRDSRVEFYNTREPGEGLPTEISGPDGAAPQSVNLRELPHEIVCLNPHKSWWDHNPRLAQLLSHTYVLPQPGHVRSSEMPKSSSISMVEHGTTPGQLNAAIASGTAWGHGAFLRVDPGATWPDVSDPARVASSRAGFSPVRFHAGGGSGVDRVTFGDANQPTDNEQAAPIPGPAGHTASPGHTQSPTSGALGGDGDPMSSSLGSPSGLTIALPLRRPGKSERQRLRKQALSAVNSAGAAAPADNARNSPPPGDRNPRDKTAGKLQAPPAPVATSRGDQPVGPIATALARGSHASAGQ